MRAIKFSPRQARGGLFGAALLFLATPACAAPCTATLCNADTLALVFRKLDRAAATHGERPVHIIQIGDSHTAGDQITGSWRTLLQAKYRSGGRGVLAAGRPYQGYLTRGITASMSPGWKVAATFGPNAAEPRPPLGLSGFSLTSLTPGAAIGLVADPGEAFDRFVVCGIARPGGGTLSVQIGATQQSIDFGSFTERPECRTIELTGANFTVNVFAPDRPVTITSWGTFRDDGGVTFSNLGVVGAQLVHFARTDDAVLAEELRAYRPDLIVIAFGTNEGFSPSFSPFSYEITLRTQIGRLRRLAGNVPILLLGAPDASSRQPALRSNAPGSPVDCGVIRPAAIVPAPQPQPTTDSLENAIWGLRDQSAQEGGPVPAPPITPPAVTAPFASPPSAPVTGLFAPPALAAVRAIQRKVAGELNLAFWDWNAAMGGACTAPKWVKQRVPPLMRGDYVHFTTAGGREIAQRLAAALDPAAK